MKLIKRVFTSITRNYVQSIMMFLVVFILGNVLFASIAIEQSSEIVKKELRQRASSGIMISLNNSSGAAKYINVVQELIEKLKKEESVTSINYQNHFQECRYYEDGSSCSNGFLGIAPGYQGIYDYEIVKGRYFTQDEIDNGELKIVLDVNSGYKVGDKYQVDVFAYKLVDVLLYTDDFEERQIYETRIAADPEKSKQIEFEVIGLYRDKRIKNEFKEYRETNIAFGQEIPALAIEKILKAEKELFESYTPGEQAYMKAASMDYRTRYDIQFVKVKTKGIDATDEIEKMILEEGNLPIRYVVTSSSQEYRYIQGPLENLVALADVVVIASAVLIVVVLSLVTNLFIKNRSHEIGILMAVGEKKKNVLGQFVLEILIVGLLATSCSMISGNLLGNAMAKEFIRIQIDVDSEMDYREENPDSLTQIDLLENFRVEISSEYIITIYLVSIFILSVSSILPVVSILKTEPKKVLM